MKVSMNVLFNSHEELAQFTTALSKLYVSPAAEPPHIHSTDAPKADKPVPAKPPSMNQKLAAKAEAAEKSTKAAAKEEPKAEPEEDAGEAPEEAAAKKNPLEPNYENMKQAVLLLNRIKGRDAIETLLKKYDGEKKGKLVVGPHIPEKHFAAIIKEVNELLAE